MTKFFFLPLVLLLSFSSIRAQNQEALSRIRLAQSFEQVGEFERASRLYEDLIQSDSTNFIYFDGLRRCYEQLKEYDAAIELSLRHLSRQPTDLNTMATLGGIYYKSGNEPLADSMWNAVIALLPSSFASYHIVASVQSENRLFDKSIATFLRGRKQIGDPTLFVGDLAALYSLLLNYPEATREYIAMLLQNEHQLDFIESRFAAFTSKEEGLTGAIKVTEESVVRLNKSVVLRRLLLWMYLEGKHFEKAFATAKELEGMITSNGGEILSFADRAFKEKAYTVAAEAYRFDIEKYPAMQQIPAAKFGYARAMEELSVVTDTIPGTTTNLFPLESQPGFHGAMAMFLSIAKEYPYTEISVLSLYHVGLIRYNKFFDLDGALKLLDSVATIPAARPMMPVIQMTMGEINTAQGELAKASQRYGGVISSTFSSGGQKSQAQFRLAEIQYFQNNFDSASSILKNLTETLSADESNDALMLLHFIKENQSGFSGALKVYANAALLEREKKVSEAIAALTSVIQTFADSPLADDAVIKKAELLIVVKQYQDALHGYQKVLSDYPLSILRDRAQFGIGELYQTQLQDKGKAIQAYEEILASYPNSLYLNEARKRIRQLRGDTI